MTQNEFIPPYDISIIHGHLFDDDPFCKNNDKTLIKFNIQLHKSVNLDGGHHHPFRSKSDSVNFSQKSRSSKIQFFNKFPERFDLTGAGTFYGSTTPLADNLLSFLFFDQLQASNRNTRTKYNLQPQPRKN